MVMHLFHISRFTNSSIHNLTKPRPKCAAHLPVIPCMHHPATDSHKGLDEAMNARLTAALRSAGQLGGGRQEAGGVALSCCNGTGGAWEDHLPLVSTQATDSWRCSFVN